MRLLWVFGAILFSFQQAFATTAGFIKSPMSQTKLVGDGALMHCEVIGSPIPEVQWWFIEGIEPNETASQLFEGAQHDRVRINTTYIQHGASTLLLYNLTFNDTGVYECRASNDPDRNALRTLPKVKWIRSQANVIVIESPVIVGKPSDFHNQTSATLSCNLTNPGSVVKGHHWEKNNKIIGGTKKDGSELYIEYTILKIEGNSGIYTCVFDSEPQVRKDIPVTGALHVLAHKHSENANENDKVVLVCDCHSYPLVTDWTWKKVEESGKEPRTIVNGTDRFTIKSTPNNSTLTIEDLINDDGGEYECWAENMNATGKVSSAKIHLRVRSRLAALWPFLGIVVEVIILITIIFIYEKRRKPDEINDDDDSGSAPLKSNSATNHKDKNVRQRNSN